MDNKKKKIGTTGKIMIAMVLGVVFGLIYPGNVDVLKLIGQIFLRLIQMSIILLVMGQIVEAIGGLKVNELGKIGIKTAIMFFFTSLLAAVWGTLAGYLLKPGSGLDVSAIQAGEVAATTQSTVYDTILNFFPSNAVQAMANGNIVQIIIFALVFGLALSYLNMDKTYKIYDLIKEFNTVILKVVRMIMKFAPIGVFCLISSSIDSYGIQVVIPLAKYLGVYALGTFSFMIIYIICVSLYTHVSPITIIKGISDMSLMALATGSSAITLPTAMKGVENKLGVKKKVSQIIMPLGVSLNSNGAAMHMIITLITIAQLYRISFSTSTVLYMILLCTLASIANAVVPGAGIVSLTIVVPQMGLPVESIALFAGVEWFVGMLRTILNVDGDAFTAMVVAKSEKLLDTNSIKNDEELEEVNA